MSRKLSCQPQGTGADSSPPQQTRFQDKHKCVCFESETTHKIGRQEGSCSKLMCKRDSHQHPPTRTADQAKTVHSSASNEQPWLFVSLGQGGRASPPLFIRAHPLEVSRTVWSGSGGFANSR
eukprot:2030176-Rhodomonas_salina.3